MFRNIKNAILFLLSGNMAGILSVLYTSLLGLPVPFAPVQLLCMNLLTDSLPAIAIGMEPSDESVLEEKQRDPSVGLLTKEFIEKILLQGILIATATMVSYYIGLETSPILASTMAFITLTTARLFHGFNCRSEHSIFKIGLTSNPFSICAFLGGVVFIALVLFVPALHSLFSVVSVTAVAVAQIIGLAILPSAIIQMVKIVMGKIKK